MIFFFFSIYIYSFGGGYYFRNQENVKLCDVACRVAMIGKKLAADGMAQCLLFSHVRKTAS